MFSNYTVHYKIADMIVNAKSIKECYNVDRLIRKAVSKKVLTYHTSGDLLRRSYDKACEILDRRIYT